jgi:nitrogen regulatory protein PII-like uncharacterized protein
MSPSELEEIRKILAQHEKRISNLERLFISKPKKIKKELSFKEFILQKQPKNNVEKVLVVGYYLEHYRGISPFNIKDLEAGFREAKEVAPKNINLAVLQNVSKGTMMEAKEKKDNLKTWTLTIKGESAVENKLGAK